MKITKVEIQRKPAQMLLALPRDSQILCVRQQREIPYIWVLWGSDSKFETRTFECYPTGDSAGPSSSKYTYIGSFGFSDAVHHIFEIL